MVKRIAIPGASGFIGKQLVLLLEANGHELVLIGRDLNKLRELFPGRRTTDYNNLHEALEGVSAVIYLAVLNNHIHASEREFENANVSLLNSVVSQSQAAKVKQFIYLATTHDHAANSTYARSKAKAAELLIHVQTPKVVIMRLPIVYGEKFTGKLGWLNPVPAALRAILFPIVASVKPTLNITKLANEIEKVLNAETSQELLLTDQQQFNWFYFATRRTVDFAFAISFILLFWWVFVILWLAVKVTSNGSGIVAQQRVGRFGAAFPLYKFRSMSEETVKAGSHETESASLTKVGGFLRKTGLDGLSQIFNILRGEISLIGPQPCLEAHEELLIARIERNILDVLPGITGYAQIQNIQASDPERLADADELYVNIRTLPLDFHILWVTIIRKFTRSKL
jgi:lipopolysaccharide/colanic/teichoic acid biosynthesis glycosyltransferase